MAGPEKVRGDARSPASSDSVSSLVCMVGAINVYVDTVYLGFVVHFFSLYSWMFQHDYLDACCFECLYACVFVFFLFAPVQRN